MHHDSSPAARPETREGRLFARMLRRRERPWERLPGSRPAGNADEGPVRPGEPPSPPATWGYGWLELYRGRELLAVWQDLPAIERALAASDPARLHTVVRRDWDGLVAGRYVVWFRDHGAVDLVPLYKERRR